MRVEEMRELIGVDSLAFLSVDGLYWAMGEPARDPMRPAIHRPLLHRRLPDPLTDQTQSDEKPRQLSLLAEAS